MFAFGDKEWPGLSKLVEECGEVLQVAGKLIQTHGAPEHWDGSNLRARLGEELSDLMAAITFFAVNNGFPVDQLEPRAEAKYQLFQKWHAAQDTTPPEPVNPDAIGTF